jgi:triosephosphate isomerase
VVFVKELRSLVKDVKDVEIVLAPSFSAIHAAAEAARNTNIGIAGQDVYWEREGAFTGEVSAPMLKEAGAEFVIVGHSERRRLFGETDAIVNRKTQAAIAAGLTPIVCVGETLEQRDSGGTLEVVLSQLQDALGGIKSEDAPRMVVAYEPVWAIGTGRNATPGQAQEVHASIREALRDHFGHAGADGIRILYGGSVTLDNVDSLMAKPDIDGALVGGASLKAETFAGIVRAHIG